MNTLWIFIVLLLAFGVVGRIDYETEVVMAQIRAEYQSQFASNRARQGDPK